MAGMRFKLPTSGASAEAERSLFHNHQQVGETRVAPAGVTTGGRYRRAAATATSPVLQALPEIRGYSLPDALAVRLDASLSSALLSEQHITALWDVLQAHTEELTSARRKSTGDVGCHVLSDAASGGDGVAPLVSARFVDIPLVERTALPDLARVGEGGSRYFLHANQLALRCGFDFIAAQKPLAAEVSGFLHLLIARKVALVIDLTTGLEQENDACYAPRRGRSLSFDSAHVSVTRKKRRHLPALRTTIESLLVRRWSSGGQKGVSGHSLERLHFAGWPDHGLISSHSLRALACQIETLHAKSATPILVHCLAGVGRTGTLVSYLAVRQRLGTQFLPQSRARQPSVVAALLIETILKGRADRGDSFVQTREQFGLVLSTLLEESVASAAGAGGESGTGARSAPAPARRFGKLANVLAGALRWTVRHLTPRVGATQAKSGAEPAVMSEPVVAMPPPPLQATVPVPAATPLPAAMQPADAGSDPVVPPKPQEVAGGATAGYRRAIAEDSLLASCFEAAMARLDQVHSVGEVDLLVAEVMSTVRQLSGPDVALNNAQEQILKGAVLQRFHRREHGIIFQAHLVRQAPAVTSPPAEEKPAVKDVSAKATARSDA